MWQRFVPRVLCCPCRQHLPSAFPSRCLLCVCPESSVCVLGQGVPGAGTAPPIPPGHCLSCLALWELSNSPSLRWGWFGRAALWSGLLRNVPPWRNGTPAFSVWPHEAPALLNPPLLPISIGLRGQLLQPDGLPVPPEAVWQAARRGRQARVQLPTLWQEVQIQGWPRLSCAVRTHGLGEPPGRLRSPRSGAIPPRGGLQSCGARGQDRAGQGRAGQGRCRRRADVVFSLKSLCTCVVPCSVGGTRVHPPPPLQKCCLREWSAAFPFPSPHRAVLQPTLHLCSAGKKKKNNRPQATPSQAPAACQCWGGRICPWGTSLSVLLIPTDSVSDTNHSLTLITGDIYTRGSTEGHSLWLLLG